MNSPIARGVWNGKTLKLHTKTRDGQEPPATINQGQYVPFRGRKTHTDVQFNAVINRQRSGDYVIFHKWYEPDWLNPKGAWETGQGLIQYK